MTMMIHHGAPLRGATYVRPITAPAPQRAYRSWGKRTLDLAFVIAFGPIALAIVLFCAVAILLTDGNPFYSQMRVGRGGREFRIWKLRTMVKNADAKLAAHLAEDRDAALEWATTQKLRRDPRITRLGAFLRKSSLDELPQVLNVLLGDMSLVGPRPMMPEQRAMYPGTDYYKLLPGITGFWQVSARNESSFAARAEFDADYNARMSLRTDLGVLAATAGVVVKATGH